MSSHWSAAVALCAFLLSERSKVCAGIKFLLVRLPKVNAVKSSNCYYIKLSEKLETAKGVFLEKWTLVNRCVNRNVIFKRILSTNFQMIKYAAERLVKNN